MMQRALRRLRSTALAAAALSALPGVASAEQPTPAEPPVRFTLIAPSADPPWTIRIENTGERPVRIPADVRLLHLTLEHGGDARARAASAVRCELPRSMRPSRFPESRALVLAPGERWQERFDPRLHCFGADRLRGGTLVRASFGWRSAAWRKPSEPFAAQSTEDPEAFKPLTELSAPSIVLAFRRGEDDPMDHDLPPGHWVDGDAGPPPPTDAASAPPSAPGRGPGGSPNRNDAPPHGGDAHARGPSGPPPGDRPAPGPRPQPSAPKPPSATDTSPSPNAGDAPTEPPIADENAGRVDIFVRRYADAHAARDVVVTIDAVNEGRRSLEAVLRGRMLSFTVEALGRDNAAMGSVTCHGSQKPHAIASESVRRYSPGQRSSIPVLLAEVCPRGTFSHPGLYRVLPFIDTTVEGEAREEQAYVGQALARQSALVRVATGSEPFPAPPPRKAPPKRPAPPRPDEEAAPESPAPPPR